MNTKKWWHETIGYQIYPKSFQDSNSDGIGDLNGITSRLDILEKLGINVIWISPINKSPMADNGYDISDYYTVDPSFGTNSDFEKLILEAHKRGIKILMDLVINHTSNQHEWFKKAMVDLDGKFAKYYIIKSGVRKNGKLLPPNNWRSIFGGSAWEQIKGTDQFYLHLFTKEQPDLNWENPKLRKELYKIIDFWVSKGISGFRIDAISHIKKDFSYENQIPDGPDQLVTAWEYYRSAKGIDKLLKELRDHAFNKYDLLNIAEMDVENPEKWEEFFGDSGYFSSIFDFYHTAYSVQQEEYKSNPIKFIEDMKDKMFQKQKMSNGKVFFTNFIENHDLPRSLNRWFPKNEICYQSASTLGMMYFFLRGIPVIYQGQEIGMLDYPKKSIDEYIDIPTHNSFRDYLAKGYSEKQALDQINIESRENSRTPLQWNSTMYAGFSTVKPWFDVNPNYTTVNYQKQLNQRQSLFQFYRKMIALRKNKNYKNTLIYGETIPKLTDIEGCISYYRRGEKTIQIICNMTNKEMLVNVPEEKKVLLTNIEPIDLTKNIINLRPYQSIVLEVKE